MAEVEVLLEGNGGLEATDTGYDTKGVTVKSFEDFDENVDMVVNAELGPLFIIFW